MQRLPQRQPIRNPHHDYSQPCSYFITIDIRFGQCLFGYAKADNQIELNSLGRMAESCWKEIPAHFPHILLGKFVVMPNHIHGIIHLRTIGAKYDNDSKAIDLPIKYIHPADFEPNHFGPLKKGSLAAVLNQFKSAVTRWANINQKDSFFEWHEKYFDRAVNDKEALFLAEKYIEMNPHKWWVKYGNRDW